MCGQRAPAALPCQRTRWQSCIVFPFLPAASVHQPQQYRPSRLCTLHPILKAEAHATPASAVQQQEQEHPAGKKPLNMDNPLNRWGHAGVAAVPLLSLPFLAGCRECVCTRVHVILQALVLPQLLGVPLACVR